MILDWGVWGPDGFPRLGRRPHRRRDHRRRSVVAQLPARPDPARHVDGRRSARRSSSPTGGHYSIDVTCRDDADAARARRRRATRRSCCRPSAAGTRATSTSTRSRAATRRRRSTEIYALATQRGLDFVEPLRSQHGRAARADRGVSSRAAPDLLFAARRRDHDLRRPRQRASGSRATSIIALGHNGRTIAEHHRRRDGAGRRCSSSTTRARSRDRVHRLRLEARRRHAVGSGQRRWS